MITGGDTCIYAYDPEKTNQSTEYRAKLEASPKGTHRSESFKNQGHGGI